MATTQRSKASSAQSFAADSETADRVRSLASNRVWLVLALLCMAGCSGNEETGTGGRAAGGGSPAATGTGTGGSGGSETGGTGGAATSTGTTGTGTTSTGTTGTGGSTGGTGGSGGSATGGTGGSGTAGSGGNGGSIVDAGKPADVGSGPVDASASTGCGAATWPASGNFNIDVAGTQRQYIVKVPAGYDTNRPYRLIMTWHGLGGTAAQVAGGRGPYGGYYGLDALAGGTAIFVSGQGLGPDGGAGWPNTGGQDVAFTRALVDSLRKSYCVDNTRIFSVGMSYGGIMSNTLGCAMGDTFRAITPQSGSGPRGTCVGQVAVWISHGNVDETVGFSQGTASRDFWLKANHCGATTTPANPSPCVSYEGCDQGKPITWCEFDGGHVIQNWAPQGIWNFLSAL
ncbi:MAG TPA: prolyl oligopeptidase family serine peptidase [Polyangiaceae bacterium]|nr:prolyl oligopeptidase family serine peptidase [Polyangiaceae bacterium]